ncbi:hypothetical protein BSKO_11079 [Bryopsis sp. KO-2023]|nr:hypothetical protein BSKO_11079 [Bryopsis sp. KO-2023]
MNNFSSSPEASHRSGQITPSISGLRTDEEVRGFRLAKWSGDEEKKHHGEGGDVALVKFGASWCHHCREVFPQFLRLTQQFPGLRYAVAQIDYMKDEAKHVEYTPTFTFYKNGARVDEVFGAEMEKLKDRMWLHSD